MLSSHSLSSFTNSCIAPPRNSVTKRPASAFERSLDHDESSFGRSKDAINDADSIQQVLQSSPLTNMLEPQPLQSMIQKKGVYKSKEELEQLLQDDDEFFSYLQDLKKESKRTLNMLERLYNNEEPLAAGHGRSRQNRNGHNHIGNLSEAMDGVDLQYDGEVGSQSSEFGSDEEPSLEKLDAENQLNILPDDAIRFRGRPSSYDIINGMWNDFSMKDHKGRIKTPPFRRKCNTWTPVTTIPRPFNMAKREAIIRKRNEKRREKLHEELEKKKQEEEEELKKKFKANPLPASTTLPLYDAIRAKDEHRRQHVKYLSKEILKATEQPFSFVKREELKREIQRSQAIAEPKFQTRSSKDSLQFKAKPFPDKLFNLSLADKQAEQEEYRKIRMQMRSEELISKSSLPPSMASRLAAQQIKKSKKKPRNGKLFQPSINREIPDFDELQRKFEDELRARRTANALTVCEPFQLHNGRVPKHTNDLSRSEVSQHHSPAKEYKTTAVKSVSRKSTAPIPYSVTETTRLRENAIRQKIENGQKTEHDRQIKELKKSKQKKQLQQQVYRKSLVNDLSRSLDDHSAERIKEFQKAEKSRQREYQRYLKELEDRVSHRPLLFEQESQTNARKRAERKYEDVLRQSGIGQDVLHKLMTEEAQSGQEFDSISGRSHSEHSQASSEDVVSEHSYVSENSKSGEEEYKETSDVISSNDEDITDT